MGVSAKAIAQKHAGKLMGDLAAAGFQCKNPSGVAAESTAQELSKMLANWVGRNLRTPEEAKAWSGKTSLKAAAGYNDVEV